MKRFAAWLLCAALPVLLTGCFQSDMDPAIYNNTEPIQTVAVMTEDPETTAADTMVLPETEPRTETEAMTESETEALTDTEPVPETDPETEEDTAAELSVEWEGTYTAPEDVALYLHVYGELPSNFITKKQAQKQGWDSSAGNLWDVCPGMSIGGDTFGNREGLLPAGSYHECDVNYEGGYRGAERLIYGDDGSIYYTNDHYKSFTQLY